MKEHWFSRHDVEYRKLAQHVSRLLSHGIQHQGRFHPVGEIRIVRIKENVPLLMQIDGVHVEQRDQKYVHHQASWRGSLTGSACDEVAQPYAQKERNGDVRLQQIIGGRTLFGQANEREYRDQEVNRDQIQPFQNVNNALWYVIWRSV